MCVLVQRPEEGIRSPRVPGSLCGCKELNSGPLQALLTIKLSLQPQQNIFSYLLSCLFECLVLFLRQDLTVYVAPNGLEVPSLKLRDPPVSIS